MKLSAGQPIPHRWRQNAAARLAAGIEAMVYQLSQYNEHRAPSDGLDEDMAYSGIADLLGCWWQRLPADELEKRIASFGEAIRTARQKRAAANATDQIIDLAVKGAA